MKRHQHATSICVFIALGFIGVFATGCLAFAKWYSSAFWMLLFSLFMGIFAWALAGDREDFEDPTDWD